MKNLIKIIIVIVLTLSLIGCEKEELTMLNEQTNILSGNIFVNNSGDSLLFNDNELIILSDYGTYVEWIYENNDSTYIVVNRSNKDIYYDWSYDNDNKYLSAYKEDKLYVFKLNIFDEYIIFVDEIFELKK